MKTKLAMTTTGSVATAVRRVALWSAVIIALYPQMGPQTAVSGRAARVGGAAGRAGRGGVDVEVATVVERRFVVYSLRVARLIMAEPPGGQRGGGGVLWSFGVSVRRCAPRHC